MTKSSLKKHRAIRGPAFRLRPARAYETEICAVVHRASYESWIFLDRNPHTPAEDRAWMRNEIFRKCEVTVAEKLGAVVGYISTQEGFISGLWVHPDHHRQGIGTALLNHAISTWPGPLELWVFEANHGAIRLYERHGFRTVHTTDGSATDEKLPDRLMRREPGTTLRTP